MRKLLLILPIASLFYSCGVKGDKQVNSSSYESGKIFVLDSLNQVESQISDTIESYLTVSGDKIGKDTKYWSSLLAKRDSLCDCRDLDNKHFTGQGHIHQGGPTLLKGSTKPMTAGFLVITNGKTESNDDHKKKCYLPFVSTTPVNPCDHLVVNVATKGFQYFCVPVYDRMGRLVKGMPVAHSLEVEPRSHAHRSGICN